MLFEYSHTKSESLAQIRTITADIQHFFIRDCFFYWHTLYITSRAKNYVTKSDQIRNAW